MTTNTFSPLRKIIFGVARLLDLQISRELCLERLLAPARGSAERHAVHVTCEARDLFLVDSCTDHPAITIAIITDHPLLDLF